MPKHGSKSEIIYLRLPTALKELVREASYYQRRPMQEIVAEALREYFSRHDTRGHYRRPQALE